MFTAATNFKVTLSVKDQAQLDLGHTHVNSVTLQKILSAARNNFLYMERQDIYKIPHVLKI